MSRYFVNDIDEIRNIEDPDSYFKFFLDHNERVNDCQRFAFDSESALSCFLGQELGSYQIA